VGFVSKEQIERARCIHVLDYVLSHEKCSVKLVGSGYRHRDHPSLAINEDGWYWHSHQTGGKSALNYLIEVHGYGLVDAVCTLLEEEPASRSDRPQPNRQAKPIKPRTPHPPKEPKSFVKPTRNDNNDRAISYLQSRGIDIALIEDCIRRGDLYESRKYRNVTFIGRDEHGKARHASMRGTLGNFKGDADGSDKKYGFILPPQDPNSNAVAVFESPVDALSHQTMCKQGLIEPFGGWRLSLGGTSTSALEHFLALRSNITHCIICLDNDKAGNRAVEKFAGLPGITVERSLPAVGSDFNEMLQTLQRVERTQHRVRHNCVRSL